MIKEGFAGARRKIMNLKKRQILGMVLSILVFMTFLSPQAKSYFYLQEKQKVSVGDSLELLLKFPPTLLNVINVHIKEGEKLLSFDGNFLNSGKYTLGVNSPVVVEPGTVKLELKLFDIIPLKKINVDVLPDVKVIPGGHSIGVLLRTEGVMVVGYSPVLNEKNESSFPAREAGIDVGDTIVKINGVRVLTDDQVKQIITSQKDKSASITLTIKRNGEIFDKVLHPKYCHESKNFRIGLFVRDNAGGVGTLTFYEPVTNKYGALGHLITDSETNRALSIRQGKILKASVESIKKAKRGAPGEKVGIFIENSELGNIEKNDTCGIFGICNKEIENPVYPDPISVAYSNNINVGPAYILTVINGQEIKKCNVVIERVMSGRLDGKNMIIRITDKNLLKYTGGIVQGMSGSPIIQDNKIIGAITHVFVNDPVRGYGVFIENMLLEANILNKNNKTLRQSSQGFYTIFCIKMENNVIKMFHII